jgi:hypothetical protein
LYLRVTVSLLVRHFVAAKNIIRAAITATSTFYLVVRTFVLLCIVLVQYVAAYSVFVVSTISTYL